ncbi:hypothetical protein F4813DRAFT_401152 [Daldinia decipiens]|uniref:uncharacterized protein n=1 Tax=Daldinia decipiens TaxID=326647 RepID=UPI0020C2F2C8|nr:uncharacterized protein F4813DRAFT_401152 [Daldinia decipiens]KAI1660169.1 hypothetical protein F4813DRAFT_401152 [Daldinia decipiens]
MEQFTSSNTRPSRDVVENDNLNLITTDNRSKPQATSNDIRVRGTLPLNPIIFRFGFVIRAYASLTSLASRWLTSSRCQPGPPAHVLIDVGMSNQIHRWTPGSVLTYNVDQGSFPNDFTAEYARNSLKGAATEWNKGDIGVRFQDVPDDQRALFRLTYTSYDRRHPNALAATFLPRVLGDQRLFVYQACFGESCIEHMTIAFCHELGHIIGLLHESAQDDGPHRPSYLLGRRNNTSVMARYLNIHLYRIPEEDYAGARRFYSARSDEFHGYRIVDKNPKVFEKLWGTRSQTIFGRCISYMIGYEVPWRI